MFLFDLYIINNVVIVVKLNLSISKFSV